ncbi:MAG TPA: hypothetical protein ENH23_06275 [candidate division Zixibacteria bacterium]|nr:hypothetical protein [candidate division Zixibacteria bacterium]
MKIAINPEDNPELSNIIKGYNELMSIWNEINKEIHSTKIPLLYHKTHINLYVNTIGIKLSEFQKKWLEFNKRADSFILNPIYKIPQSSDQSTIFFHYQITLINKINHLRTNMVLIDENYNHTYSQLSSKRDYTIAISSFVLGFIGLIFSLMK